jgi:hypothetical protein
MFIDCEPLRAVAREARDARTNRARIARMTGCNEPAAGLTWRKDHPDRRPDCQPHARGRQLRGALLGSWRHHRWSDRNCGPRRVTVARPRARRVAIGHGVLALSPTGKVIDKVGGRAGVSISTSMASPVFKMAWARRRERIPEVMSISTQRSRTP